MYIDAAVDESAWSLGRICCIRTVKLHQSVGWWIVTRSSSCARLQLTGNMSSVQIVLVMCTMQSEGLCSQYWIHLETSAVFYCGGCGCLEVDH